MQKTDDGKLILTRREFDTVLAHGAGGGILSGWFGDEDDTNSGGVGILDDFEIRDKDGHVITDPETIEFLGDALEVTRPNAYDEGVRISVSGDVAVKDQDINPKSVGKDDPAELVNTDDQTINQSVTWPDGSTTTTSPSGGGETKGAYADAEITSIPTGGDPHVGLPSAVFPINNEDIVVVYRSATDHNADTSATLRAIDGKWDGSGWSNDREIVNNSNDIIDGAAAIMGGGRLGIVVSQRDGSGNMLDPLFVYSDDDGATWSTSTIVKSAPRVVDNKLYPYPASVGGDDTDGWITYFHDGTTVDYLYTTDNGTSWTSGQIIPSSDGGTPVEVVVGRVGTQDKWVLISRENETGGSTARAWTSTDMLNWSGPTDTNQWLGQNPQGLVYEDGKFHWMAFSRDYMGEWIERYGDALLVQSADAATIYDDPTAWSGWEKYLDIDHPLGYPDFNQQTGDLFGTFTSREVNQNASELFMLSPPEDREQPDVYGHAYLTSNQSGFASTEKILLDETARGEMSGCRLVNSGIQVMADGTYELAGGARWDDLASGEFAIVNISTSAGDTLVQTGVNGGSGEVSNPISPSQEELSAGDTVILEAVQSTSNARTIAGLSTADTGFKRTWLTVRRVDQ